MATLDKIKQPITAEMKAFDEKFKGYLSSNVPLVDRVMRYMVKRKGKQLRPILVFLSAKISGDVTTANYFGENKKTTAEFIASLSTNVPKNVRLTKFEISEKRNISIDGVAKDDQSIIEMIDKFTEAEIVQEAKLNNVVNFTEEDRNQLYAQKGKAAPENIPNEDITKKFSATIAMAPIEGEKFDNFKVLDKLIKKKR